MTKHNNNNYPGGKGGDGVYQQIINYIPPHSVYVSPFAGKDAIYRNLLPGSIAILNDTDPQIINYWKHYLKSFPEFSVHENFIQGNFFNADNKKHKVILRNNEAIFIINKFCQSQNTFIYCDPPYPLKVRKNKRQLYAFEFADEEQHVKLLEALLECTCNVMISTYENDLYNHYLTAISPVNVITRKLQRTWYKHSFVAQTRQGQAIETIYFNYEPPVILHDFRYLGKNFRERERIKRKVKRFQERMKMLPAAERNAILSAAVNNFNETLNTIIHL